MNRRRFRTRLDPADLFVRGVSPVFASMTETYGNVTVEAMASGLAVVAYRYAAAAEHIVHDENGLYAEFGNEEKFIQLACNLANDAERINRLRIQSHLSMLQLDWQNIVDEFEQALAQLALPQEVRHAATKLQPATNSNLG